MSVVLRLAAGNDQFETSMRRAVQAVATFMVEHADLLRDLDREVKRTRRSAMRAAYRRKTRRRRR